MNSQPYESQHHSYGMDPYSVTPPPPPESEPHPPARQPRRRILTIAGLILLLIVVLGTGCFVANALTGGVTARHSAIMLTATPTQAGFYATVTPIPGASPTPTVGPHTPTPPPIVVYVTGTPRPLYPTYTPQRPYPTFTPPPNPTRTPTPHPILTLDDPLATQADQFPGSGWSQSSIENGTQPVMSRNTNDESGFTWHLAHIRTATITAYYCVVPSSDGSVCGTPSPTVVDMGFSCSTDDASWVPCTITGRTQAWASTPSNGQSPFWQVVVWSMTAPAGTNYLQTSIAANYPVAFGFGEGDFTYQP